MNRPGKTPRRAKKGKQPISRQEGIEKVQARGPNFNEKETDVLMEAAREVQVQSGKTDLNFTTPELQQVFSLFCAHSSGIHRTLQQLKTRLRTLKKEYNIFRELATKSGWMWDYENHVPVPPTPEILREMCQRDDRLKYFDTKKFPWYDLMTRMCGGRMSTSKQRINSHTTQNSAMGSSTGSSDDPVDEEQRVDETNDTIEQEVPYNVGVEANTSEAGISASRSSGSQKRKDRDGSGDMSRGQKIQKRISAKSIGLQQIADILSLLKSMSRLLKSHDG